MELKYCKNEDQVVNVIIKSLNLLLSSSKKYLFALFFGEKKKQETRLS